MVDNIDKKIDAVVGEAIEDAIENEAPVEIEIVLQFSFIFISSVYNKT